MAAVSRMDLSMDELQAIVERAKSAPLSEAECDKLKAVLETLEFLTRELEKKGVSVRRLRKMLFGASTEKTRNIFGGVSDEGGRQQQEKAAGRSGQREAAGDGSERRKKKRKGHGRNAAACYCGAERIRVQHPSLKPGDSCPLCIKGKLYEQRQPGVIVRIKGQAPITARVWELQRLRCGLCGKLFVADAPEGIGQDKYDESAASMIAMLRYGCGFPFYRLGKLQANLGIPLSPSTQFDVLNAHAAGPKSAFEELQRHAANGRLFYNDDTTMKILELMANGSDKHNDENKAEQNIDESQDGSSERTGVFTSGIVSESDGHRIGLFFTGRRHAGENLHDVLLQRTSGLSPPIQMSDGLSRNIPPNLPPRLQTIWANCMSHARRRFVDVSHNFPDECLHVLEQLGYIYDNDDIARQLKMSDQQRLSLHQAHSGPIMEQLNKWMDEQLKQKKVEPNSGLGDAMEYMLKRWDKLTLFLTVAGAPIDNNLCEQALKKMILMRKNSLFYKTQNGARVGDMFLSLIHTAELNGVNAFDYLTQLMRHPEQVNKDPGKWMPWNYRQTLEQLRLSEQPLSPAA